MPDQAGQLIDNAIRDLDFMMLGAVALGNLPGERAFVMAGLAGGEAHRKSLYSRSSGLSHEGDKRGAVDAAGEKCSNRHVRYQLPFDRLLQQAANFVDALCLRHTRNLSHEGDVCIPLDDGFFALMSDQAFAGPELVYSFEDGQWRGDEAVRQVLLDGWQTEPAGKRVILQ
jgi:hypothetical protein